MRRRSVLGFGLAMFSSAVGCARDGGECVPGAELSPSGGGSASTGWPADFRVSPDEYLSWEGLAVSPDGSLVAANETWHRRALKLSSTYGTTLWDVNSGKVVRRLGNERIGALAWHPGGELLAVGDESTIQVVDLEGNPKWELRGHRKTDLRPGIIDVAFNAKGDCLASVSRDGTVRLWGVGPGECRSMRVLEMEEPRNVSFSSGGDRLAVAAKDGCSVWDVGRGTRITRFDGVPSPVKGVAYGPGDVLVAVTAEPGASYLIGPDGSVSPGRKPPSSNPECVAVSAGWEVAVSAVGDSRVGTWERDARAPSEVQAPGAVSRVAWSPDGKKLFGVSMIYGLMCWSSGKLRVFDLPED